MNRLIVIVILIVVAAAVFLWQRPAETPAEVAETAADAAGIVPFLMEQQWLIKMKLALAEDAELAPQIHSTGRIVPVPSNRAAVAPPVGGIIDVGTLPRIGEQVQRGQVLATLLQTPTAAEAEAIRIENIRVEAERRRLGQAEAESRARLSAAAAEAGRAVRLFEKKAYSQRQVELAEAEHKAAEAGLAAIREQLQALQISAPAFTYEVRAPISGTIVGASKSVGEQAAPGETIFEIIALDTLWVEAPIFEKDLGRLHPNTEAVFTTAAYPEREFRGRLINVGSVIDEQTRAATAIFEVNNRSDELRIGMQANIRLDGGAKQKVLLVPREAIMDNEGRKIVYVLRSGEEFERRHVEIGDEYGSKVAILSGVKPGERVVTQGAYQLKLQELKPAGATAHTHES